MVNEVIDDDLTANQTLRDSVFSRTLGTAFIELAFRVAHEADPNAKLYINEWGLEAKNNRSDQLYALVKDLKGKGVPIHGVGLQVSDRVTTCPVFCTVFYNSIFYAHVVVILIIVFCLF